MHLFCHPRLIRGSLFISIITPAQAVWPDTRPNSYTSACRYLAAVALAAAKLLAAVAVGLPAAKAAAAHHAPLALHHAWPATVTALQVGRTTPAHQLPLTTVEYSHCELQGAKVLRDPVPQVLACKRQAPQKSKVMCKVPSAICKV